MFIRDVDDKYAYHSHDSQIIIYSFIYLFNHSLHYYEILGPISRYKCKDKLNFFLESTNFKNEFLFQTQYLYEITMKEWERQFLIH